MFTDLHTANKCPPFTNQIKFIVLINRKISLVKFWQKCLWLSLSDLSSICSYNEAVSTSTSNGHENIFKLISCTWKSWNLTLKSLLKSFDSSVNWLMWKHNTYFLLSAEFPKKLSFIFKWLYMTIQLMNQLTLHL